MRHSWGYGLSLILVACGGQTELGDRSEGADDNAMPSDAAVDGGVSPEAGGSGGAPAVGGTGGGSAGGEMGGFAGGETGGSAGGEMGGSAGTTSDAGSAVTCIPSAGGSGGFVQPTCDDLSNLAVTDPQVVDDSGDGVVSAGEDATIHVVMRELGGEDFMFYPGVLFEADHASVDIGAEDWRYGIFACGADELTTHAHFGQDIAPGTVIQITARVAMLNSDCPDAPSVTIEVPVQ